MKRWGLWLALWLVAANLLACAGLPGGKADLAVVAGSENETLEPLIQRFAKQKGYRIQVSYKGSVDIMLGLQDANFAYDAVWPAHNLWIALGDAQLKRVKQAESILRSPVVFGIRRGLAQELGWVGREVLVADILAAAESGKLRFMMTNATQSNSGAIAYLGFLYSFLGRPDIITLADLDRPELAAKMRALLGAVNRSSGSSGWLKDLYLQNTGLYDGMVNYEAVIIEINQELTKRGEEPLYVIYPTDGQAIADSPLAYVDKGNDRAKKVFDELQAYLLRPETQQELLKQGRRAGPLGLSGAEVDRRVFNPDWGIDTERVINQIPLPQPEVVRKALDLYQTTFRKPSLTVFALDYSGSMAGEGARALREAMATLLEPDSAARLMLQTGADDVTIVIPFSSKPIATWAVQGNAEADLANLLAQVRQLEPNGGTDIYLPVVEGLRLMQQRGDLDAYQPAIILMTDGKSNSEDNLRLLQQEWQAQGRDIPVYGILFGEADPDQVEAIAALTRGRVFDGGKDLTQAFRAAKGYN